MVPKICSVDDCDSTTRALGYCNPHYKRFKRWGDASIKRPTIPAEDRFHSKVHKRGADECWPWTAGTTKQGYGGFHPSKGETVMAHRYMYELERGPIAGGDVIDHACHNGQSCPPGPCEHRLCCNPAHLEPMSITDNVNRSHNSNIKKMHCPRGHAYTPQNTIHQKKHNTISRKCRACEHGRDATRRNRKAA